MRFNNIHYVPHWCATERVALIVPFGEEAINGEAEAYSGGMRAYYVSLVEQ
ncbi:hypothetical protein DVH05_015495 [Phytophthora capsici]|nr:hypothetical protein DVH05_015495 [Phytophthora capsici]